MKRRDVLETLLDAEDTYGSLITNSQFPRRDVMRCVRAGLAKSVGMVVVMDGDGYAIEPERHREGFVITDKGRRAVMRAVVLALALLPTFAPTSGLNEQTLTTVEVVAASEAPQVGFEPTTLRLTEGSGRETGSFIYTELAPTPLVRVLYGTGGIQPGLPKSPRQPPRESRGYWAAAPPRGVA